MRQLLILVMLCGTAWGAQSVVVTTSPMVTLPNSAPYSTFTVSSPMRWELRIHDFGANWPTNGFELGPVTLYNIGTAVFATTFGGVNPDTINDNGPYIDGCCAGRTDVLVRVQRDVVNSRWTLEICDTTGGNCQTGSSLITAHGVQSFAGKQIGPVSGEDVAFARWFSSVVPLGTPIPIIATGDLGDWEFEGDLTDSSGHGLTMIGGSVSYVPTPTYAPVCNAGAQQAFRAGYSAGLNGAGSTSFGNPLSYAWTQISGPTVALVNPTTATPSITVIPAGSYTFSLTVTDSSWGSGVPCTVDDGAVTTDANGVVVTGNPAVDTLLGPMLRWGANPWPWNDDRLKKDADIQIANMDTVYGAWWNVADPGTITVTAGSTTVTGSGTNFLSTVCSGTGGAVTQYLVVWYPISTGITGRRIVYVDHCSSDSSLTMTGVWRTDVSAGTGLGYSDSTNSVAWGYGAAPANYYDNVVAFYRLYYSSGILDYLNAARKLADRWWICPEIDRGNAYAMNYDGETNGNWAPRQSATMGLVIRALDGPPADMWSGLDKIFQWYWDLTFNPTWYNYSVLPSLGDVRETSYALASLSYCALYDTTTTKATCQGWVNNVIAGYFTTARFSDGSWRDFYGNYDLTTAVKMTNGSTAVDGGSGNGCGVSSTAWTAGEWPVGELTAPLYTPIWLFSPANALPQTNGVSPVVYTATYVDATHVALTSAFTGTTGCYGWVAGIDWLVGWGNLPYMEGMLSQAFGLASKALATPYPTTSVTARQYGLDAANWVMNNGYRVTTKSVYYAAGYANCQPPIPETNTYCTQEWDADVARPVSAEVIRPMLESGTTALRNMAILLYNANWSKPGTCPGGSTLCVEDGYYDTAFDDDEQNISCSSGTVGTTCQAPKWFGQWWGYTGSPLGWIFQGNVRTRTVFGRVVSGRGVVR